jgi:hypothetical protein
LIAGTPFGQTTELDQYKEFRAETPRNDPGMTA